jgi:inosine triphosphate pyrophosphatase
MANIGHEGLNKMLVGFNDTSAEAICTFAYSAGPGTEPIVFEGRTAGRIVPARGSKVFGWDAVFEPAGVVPEQTYAEMDPVEKNTISHRYKALAQLRTFLQSQS